jgi:uncharacterized cofD-like protein
LGRAAAILSELLPLNGSALPVAEEAVTLCAQLTDGQIVKGESEISSGSGPIERLWLEPEKVQPAPGVLESIERADALVFGPGSLYTSLLPNLLVQNVTPAIRRSSAAKIFVCNLLTQRGETVGFSAADHLRTLNSFLGSRQVDYCIVNADSTVRAGGKMQDRGEKQAGEPVACDWAEIERLGAIPICAELALDHDGQVRHDPAKLAQLILALARAGASGLDRRMRPAAAA